MATATKNGGTAGSYGYDAFDERVSRQTFGGGAINRNYIFDAEGRLMAEHDAATGAVVREYIWIDDMPVAMVQYPGSTSPATYYIHTGQVGEPLMMTDASKAIVWNNVMDPYGTATPLGTDTVSLDLRYPGQWLQPETGGLAQNWFRDYDASIGRYAQVDPLGIQGGFNAYAYALSNPVNGVDRAGLAANDNFPSFPPRKAFCEPSCENAVVNCYLWTAGIPDPFTQNRMRSNCAKIFGECKRVELVPHPRTTFNVIFPHGGYVTFAATD